MTGRGEGAALEGKVNVGGGDDASMVVGVRAALADEGCFCCGCGACRGDTAGVPSGGRCREGGGGTDPAEAELAALLFFFGCI